MKLMEDAFQNVNVQDFKVHLAENNYHHTAIVSKKSASEREYTMISPKTVKRPQQEMLINVL